MKIRIKGNSVRLRLSKTEVQMFREKGLVEASTNFGMEKLFYCLKQRPQSEKLKAHLSANTISISMESTLADKFSTTELMGVEDKQSIDGNDHLMILVEKDLKCLDETTEDQSDFYENPKSVC